MTAARRTAVLVGATMAASSLVLTTTATSASAADREFRYAGAEIDYDVEKDDGRFEIDVDVDDAKPGSRWRVILKHDGKRFHQAVHRADSDGELDIEKNRANTSGKDVFTLKIKRIGADKAAVRTIRAR